MQKNPEKRGETQSTLFQGRAQGGLWMKRWCKFFYPILLVHFLACATVPNTHVAGHQAEIPRETPSEGEVAAVKVTVENSCEAPLDNFLAEEGSGDKNILDTALDFYQASQGLWSRGDLEAAIHSLDEAYSLILKVNSDSEPATIQEKDDLRILISRRLTEIYASRRTAVNGNHKAIPLTMNEHVQYEIKQFQTVERDFFINSYKRSGRYIDKIAKEFNEAGLPVELAWLPLVESGFNVRALSPSRALGLWQFIPSTGYKFGLKRDDWIDERLDPEKSTKAAIAYLQELHLMFGDWTTVLAAYNSGEGNVLRIIKEQKINYLDNFWDLYERFRRETARYVPRFLATLHILKEPERYGLDLGETEEPLSFEVVTIEKQVGLGAITKELKISEGSLSDLNPELRLEVTPPTRYSLRIPPALSEVLAASLCSLPEWPGVRSRLPKRHAKSCSESSYAYHRVSKGETLSSIANRYETTVAAISEANNIRNRQLIKTGQMLKIPSCGGKVYASKTGERHTR